MRQLVHFEFECCVSSHFTGSMQSCLIEFWHHFFSCFVCRGVLFWCSFSFASFFSDGIIHYFSINVDETTSFSHQVFICRDQSHRQLLTCSKMAYSLKSVQYKVRLIKLEEKQRWHQKSISIVSSVSFLFSVNAFILHDDELILPMRALSFFFFIVLSLTCCVPIFFAILLPTWYPWQLAPGTCT